MFHPLLIENDVAIPMRDGVELSANVFRPQAEGRFPVIITLGPYPKDIHFKDWDRLGFYANLEEHGPHMHWETVNPDWWVPQGYVVIRIDTRGTGKSKGRPSLLSMREAEDFYDAIEWSSAAPYSNGKVAVMGISYFAMNAWRVASLRPPHLAANLAVMRRARTRPSPRDRDRSPGRLAPFTHTDPSDRIQTGRVRVYTGRGHDSHLPLPRIPPWQ